MWSQNSKLTFHRSQETNADIVITFFRLSHGDNMSFDGPGNVLGHAFFPGSGMGGDVHFDADEKWVRSGTVDPSGKSISGYY